jgi:ABC-2 type transport system permease protein
MSDRITLRHSGAFVLALHSEWTKLRTLANTFWLLGASVIVTIVTSALILNSIPSHDLASIDIVKTTLSGIEIGQAIVCIIAVLAVSNEYSSGMMQLTLTALPRRLPVVAAKAACVTVLAIGAGAVSVAGCLIAGRLVLLDRGGHAARDVALLSLSSPGTLRAALGSVLYLALIALLCTGVAFVARDPAAGIGVVLALLYFFPLLAQTISDPQARLRLEQIGPMTAGLAIQSTTGLASLPISPWAGLGVLGAWSLGAILAGGVIFRVRDA